MKIFVRELILDIEPIDDKEVVVNSISLVTGGSCRYRNFPLYDEVKRLVGYHSEFLAKLILSDHDDAKKRSMASEVLSRVYDEMKASYIRDIPFKIFKLTTVYNDIGLLDGENPISLAFTDEFVESDKYAYHSAMMNSIQFSRYLREEISLLTSMPETHHPRFRVALELAVNELASKFIVYYSDGLIDRMEKGGISKIINLYTHN